MEFKGRVRVCVSIKGFSSSYRRGIAGKSGAMQPKLAKRLALSRSIKAFNASLSKLRFFFQIGQSLRFFKMNVVGCAVGFARLAAFGSIVMPHVKNMSFADLGLIQ